MGIYNNEQTIDEWDVCVQVSQKIITLTYIYYNKMVILIRNSLKK